MQSGLYQQRAAKRQDLTRNRADADAETQPHARHLATVNVETLGREITALHDAIQENEDSIVRLEGFLLKLAASKHKSRHRSLVITHLEEAQDRLRRELGDPVS